MAFTAFHGPDFAFESFPPEAGPLTPRLIEWHRQAVALGRVPCVYLTAGWCPPSVKLERSLSDPRMQRALREVQVATFDIDAWGDRLTEAGFTAHTVPIFFIIDAGGRPAGARINGSAWGEDDAEHMAPPLERFFDALRPQAQPPARGAFAPPAAVAAPSAAAAWRGVAMIVAALLVIGVVAWLKVSKDRENDATERNERLRKEVEASIRNSLNQPKE